MKYNMESFVTIGRKIHLYLSFEVKENMRRHIEKSIMQIKIKFALLSILLLLTTTGYSQYFGQNKPKYESQNFTVLTTPHFDIYHYMRDRDQLEKLAQWTEQWYDMHQEVFRDTFSQRNPFILYKIGRASCRGGGETCGAMG